MSVESLSNSSITVYAQSQIADDYGTASLSDVEKLSDVSVRLQPMSGREQALYGSERVVATHKMFVAGDVDIQESDVVVDTDSVRYDVTFVKNVDKLGHHKEIEMREIRKSL